MKEMKYVRIDRIAIPGDRRLQQGETKRNEVLLNAFKISVIKRCALWIRCSNGKITSLRGA
jgi:hypothetical protein